VALLPLVLALTVSARFAVLTAVVLAGAASLVTPHVGSGLRAIRPTRERHLWAFVLSVELIAAAWGLFLVVRSPSAGMFVGLGVVVLSVGTGWRLRSGRRSLDVMAGVPLLAVPLLGFARAPSPWILVAIAGIVVALRAALADRWNVRVPEALASVAAPVALASILMVPLAFRDLPSVNHGEHESFNLAWINSALHGKMLLADAGLLHGPLRDYSMIAFLSPFGITFEHVRIGFVVVNLVGLAMLFPVVWALARRNLWIHAFGVYLLLMQTPARTILWYKHMTSFGWADLVRTALPTLALFGAVSVADGPDAARRTAPWGFVMGLSLLYSQEFGLCAAGAALLAIFVDRLLLAKAPFGSRLARGAIAGAGFSAGMFVPPLALLAVYAAMGRGGRLVTTAIESLSFASAGVWGSIRFPLDRVSMVDPWVLFREFGNWSKHFDSPVIYLLPIAAYVVAGTALAARLVGRRWNRRASLELALLAFGATSYRVTMATPDIWHLLSTTTPAILLLVALAADASRFRCHFEAGTRLWVGRACVAALAVVVLGFGEYSTGVVRKLAEFGDGTEKPSGPERYQHADIPRAGDVLIPAHVRDIVTYVHKEVKENEPIFVCAGMFDGAELYFLTDRRNPSRFDTLSELVTQSRRDELLQALQDDPPALIIGNEMSFFGETITDYVAAHWEAPVSQGGYTIRKRKK
jgi:hypothetical protein